MILTRVDRCHGGVLPEFSGQGAQWARLTRLAARIGCPAWPVDLVLVSDESMSDLNRRYRDGEGVTDVLSFSYLEAVGVAAADLVAGTGHALHDLWLPEGPEAEGTVGELVLAPAFIGERCRENGWPVGAEIALLIVHGCLHLLGWDHENAAAQGAMQTVEKTLLAGEGLAHPLLKRS